MSKKDYEAAARIVRAADEGDRAAMFAAFCALFTQDSARFDWLRFKAACIPGANVRARPRS